MGAADVVPGVSGGTMAFILGIYKRLIDAIKSFDSAWITAALRFDVATVLRRPHFGFLIPLAIGIVGAIVFFTRVVPIPKLLVSNPEHVYAFFFGLIVGSIAVLFGELKYRSFADVGALVAGIVIGGLVVTAVPTQTPETWWFIVASGAIAICAMVLPGISGSFILLILGKYAYVLNALGNFEFRVIIPFAIGAAIGLVAFTRLLSWLLSHFERAMLLVITGFLVASLWIVWPFQQREFVLVRGKQRLIDSTPVAPNWDLVSLEAFILALVGISLVLAVNWMARSRGEQQS